VSWSIKKKEVIFPQIFKKPTLLYQLLRYFKRQVLLEIGVQHKGRTRSSIWV